MRIRIYGNKCFSNTGFPSIVWDLGVTQGKWYYQVLLGTNGIEQIGWSYHKEFQHEVKKFKLRN
jgi:hypothetical protein